jgi:hypothetical protein
MTSPANKSAAGKGGITDAARHGGSPAARERRLAEMSKQQNIGLPKNYDTETVMVATTAGPGLRFTYVFKLVNLTRSHVDAAKLAAAVKSKLIDKYKTLSELADFRKWQVELRWQYLDKDGREITTVAASPQDL